MALISIVAWGQKKNKADNKAETKPELKTQQDSISYSLGVLIGTSMKMEGLTGVINALIVQGMDAVLKDKTQLITSDQATKLVQQYATAQASKVGERNLAEGKKFLAENAKKEGVISLPSGLQYKVIKEGTGDKPSAADKVTVHYHGTLINGKVFDSSVQRGQPATFPLNGVIKGWTEGVQLMSTGAKYTFFLPADLAYGEQGTRGIEPNSVLVFEVELISFEKSQQ